VPVAQPSDHAALPCTDGTSAFTSADPRPGVSRRTGRGHVESFGDGRVCAQSGCTTRLSRYNSASLCWQHEETSTGVGARRSK
jgi:hypothetical protein